ncbi:hypothetical protein ACFXEL_23505 [Streptomyces sp. NPDC059382]|uniref:hypothetical protein n=1 Tax=Streptomyces sp. NPDC059382 TaxID=3346816 RepID=UPI0036B52CEF
MEQMKVFSRGERMARVWDGLRPLVPSDAGLGRRTGQDPPRTAEQDRIPLERLPAYAPELNAEAAEQGKGIRRIDNNPGGGKSFLTTFLVR